MKKTPFWCTAALVALSLPAVALRAADPEPETPGQRAAERKAPADNAPGKPDGSRDRAEGFAPDDRNDSKLRRAPSTTTLSIETKDGVQRFKDGYLTRAGQSMLFRRRDERAIIVFTLAKEATAWWTLGDSSGVIYVADGKLRFAAAEGVAAESELGPAPDGAPATSAGSAQVAWLSGGKAWACVAGKSEPREVVPSEGREFVSIALSPDGLRLFATFKVRAEEGRSEIAWFNLSPEAIGAWSTRWTTKDGTPANLAVGNDQETVLFTQPRTAGGRSMTAVKVLRAKELEPATLTVADDVADLLPGSGNDGALFSAKGANGRRKIWRVELMMRPDAEEHFIQCLAEFEDGDCTGLTRASANGTSWFVKKTEGAADRVCTLVGN